MTPSKFLVLFFVGGVCSSTTTVLPQEGSDVVPAVDACENSKESYPRLVNIRWVSRDQITVISELVYGGSELGNPQYVGRGRVSSEHEEWVPGKAISLDNGNFRIFSPFEGKEYKFDKYYEFLIASRGATSWVTVDYMPSNAIIGGNDPRTLDITRICRAVYDGRQMIGKTFTDATSCILPYKGGEYKSHASVQVLVENCYHHSNSEVIPK